MTILDKEGKVYTLTGPNPLVEKQATWDQSGLIFHNFEWDEIKSKSESSNKKQKISEMPAAPKVPAEEPIRQIEKEPEVRVQETQDDGREFDLPYIKYKVLSYCLPANVQEKKDSLYGDSWSTVKYGKKFVFPSVIISSTDLSLELWTSDPNGQITERSIIYPFSYEVHNQNTDAHDRVPYDEYRWWKVSSKEKKQEGWLFKAFPSDIQPDFSE